MAANFYRSQTLMPEATILPSIPWVFIYVSTMAMQRLRPARLLARHDQVLASNGYSHWTVLRIPVGPQREWCDQIGGQ